MALCDGPQGVSPDPTQVQDGRVDGEEALGVPGRFEAAHESFPESRRPPINRPSSVSARCGVSSRPLSSSGIDAIAILINGSLVTDSELVAELAETNGYLDVTFVFVQAERSAAFDGAKIGTFGFGVNDFFRDPPQLPRDEAIREAASIMSAIYKLSPRFTRGNPACRLYYVTTGRWVNDANLVARQQAVVDDLETTRLFRDIEFIDVDADTIQRLYNQTKNAISRDITFAARTALPEIPGVDEAYLGLLPAPEFMSLLQDETGILVKSIFYENVRDWQDYNPVNTEIRGTLESAQQRPRFALMNNGVTIIASTLRATGNRFHLEDYQIVNGCQTSHVLFDQRANLDDTVLIPLRLIATRDEELIAAIVKATNRQTQNTLGMLGGPRERSGFPPPSGSFTPPLCGLVLLRRSHTCVSSWARTSTTTIASETTRDSTTSSCNDRHRR